MAFSNARKTPCDQGHMHPSGAEARCCNGLTKRQDAGEISGLTQQPRCVLAFCVKYKCDFLYFEGGREIWHEEKGRTDRRFAMIKQLWKRWGPATLRITHPKKKTVEITPKENHLVK